MRITSRPRLGLIGIAAAVAIVASGCTSGGQAPTDDGGTPPTEPTGNITVRLFSGLTALDPFADSNQGAWEIFRQMYEGLVVSDANLEPQPLLAESWESNEDASEWTFHLRDDVKFHDGTTMDADDVAYSLNYFQNNAEFDVTIGDVDVIEAIDPLTVVVKLNTPKASLVDDLAAPIAPVIVPDGAADNGALTTAENGTGPFYLDEYEPEIRALLRPFTDHYVVEGEVSGLSGPRVALLESLEIVIVEDDGVAVQGFRTGEYDIDTNLSTVDAESLKSEPGLQVVSQPVSDWVRFSLNLGGSELMGNKLIRQALTHAVDPQGYVDSTALGFGRVVHSLIPPEANWFIPGVSDYWPYEYDPAKAEALLKEAGYDGTPIEVLAGGPTLQEQNAIVLQQQAAEVGLNIEVNHLDHPTFLGRGVNGEYEITSANGTFDFTPDIFYNSWVCGANKRFNYCNDEYDATYQQAVETVDRDERRVLFGELEKMLKDDAVVLPLYLRVAAQGVNERVHNYQPNFLNAVALWNVWATDAQ